MGRVEFLWLPGDGIRFLSSRYFRNRRWLVVANQYAQRHPEKQKAIHIEALLF